MSTSTSKPLPKIYRIIVFALTRTETVHLHNALNAVSAVQNENLLRQGISIEPLLYHAGLIDEARETAHSDWTVEEPLHHSLPMEESHNVTSFRIMICTSAFGTGIDVPDVRATIHIGAARSLVDFVQESGRAGRDGRHAFVYILFSEQYEAHFQASLLNKTDDEERTLAITKRNVMMRWVRNDTDCRKNALYTAMDGQVSGVCRFNRHAVWCDVCKSMFPSQPSNKPCTPHSSQNQAEDTTQPCSDRNSHSQFRLQQRSLTLAPSQSQSQPQIHAPPQPQHQDNELLCTTADPHPSLDEIFELYAPVSVPSPALPDPVRRALHFSSEPSSDNVHSLPSESTPRTCKDQDTPSRKRTASQSPYGSNSFKVHRSSNPGSQRNAFAQQRLHPMGVAPLPNQPAPNPTHSLPTSLPFHVIEALNADSTLLLIQQCVHLLKTTCFLCLASPRSAPGHPQKDCPFTKRSCFSCFSTTHYASDCHVPRTVRSTCFKCHMSHCMEYPLHPNFGRFAQCDLAPMRALVWTLWRTKSFRSQIVEHLFSSEMLRRFNAVRQDRPSQTIEMEMALIFSDALTASVTESHDGKPLTILLTLAWAMYQGLLH